MHTHRERPTRPGLTRKRAPLQLCAQESSVEESTAGPAPESINDIVEPPVPAKSGCGLRQTRSP